MLGTSTVRPVSQWSSTTIKMRNTMDHLLWVRQVRRLTCSMTQAHQICGCPTPIVTMVLKSQFLPRMQIKHLRRQRQHIQDRVRLRSSVRFLLQGHCERWGCVNRRLHFAEMTNVSGLGISYSLENLTESAAWLYDPLPRSILWTELILQWKV